MATRSKTTSPEIEAARSQLVPWLEPSLIELLAGRERLHHALLIHGPSGIGKAAFAKHLAMGLLCEQPAHQRAEQIGGCGKCQACHWFNERAHPDFRSVLPEIADPDFVPSKSKKPSNEIRVDQIRALSRFLAVGSHRNGWRIVLIDPAHAMNHITANGLLKTLEEPGQKTLLILVTSHPNRLAPTIRSRCRAVPLSAPPTAQALEWLANHGANDSSVATAALAAAGSPMHALDLVEPGQATAHQAILETIAALPDTAGLRAVDALDSHEPLRWADVLLRWLSDLARVKAGSEPQFYPGSTGRLTSLSTRTSLGRLTRLQRQLGDLSARIEHPLNPRLICESSVLAYCRLFDPQA